MNGKKLLSRILVILFLFSTISSGLLANAENEMMTEIETQNTTEVTDNKDIMETLESEVRREAKKVEVKITDFAFVGSDINVSTDKLYQLNYKWTVSVSENTLLSGDWFEIDLPEKFDFSTNFSDKVFDVMSDEGEVLGEAELMSASKNGGKLKLVFNNYVDDKYEICGNLSIQAKFTDADYSTDKKTENYNNLKKAKEKAKGREVFKGNRSTILSRTTPNLKLKRKLLRAPAFKTGDTMQNGELKVYDDSHKIIDTSNGDGSTVSEYNLATMTDTLFSVSYKPFFSVNDEGIKEYGDQRIVVDFPTYGFKLTNPGNIGTQFKEITLLDAKGKVIPLDPATHKDYEKVVKIIYDINDSFLGSLGSSLSMVFNIAFERRSLSNSDCKKWLNEGKLETKLKVVVAEGEDNEAINSAGNPSTYTWRMSPKNYEDTKTSVEGDRHLNSSAYGPIANMSLTDFHANSAQSGPYNDNYDYYFYKHGTIHDGDTPLMKLKAVKLYVPKTAGAESNFYLNKFWEVVKNKYDNQIAHFFNISEIKNDGDGKGNYYILTPKNPIYNNGKDHQWTESFSNGFSPVWQVPNGIEDLGSDTLYSAETPEFVFEMPNGTDGSKEVVISEPNQGVKIQTLKSQVADTYSITSFNQPGFRLYKNSTGYKYTANAVSPDANYSNVAYTWLSNNHYTLKDSSGKWNEYIPKNKTGATVETYEFPKEIQPTAWTGASGYWGAGRTKMGKVVYWTEDGQEHTVEINDYVYLNNGGNHFPRVEFDTAGGRVKKVEVHWEFLNNKVFNATTYMAGQFTATNHSNKSGQSKFDYYVTPEATGLLKVSYKAESVDPEADPNDNFTYEAEKVVNNPANDVTGKAEDDFFWVTVVKKPCTPMVAFSTDERRKENNALIPNQAENGTFFDSWMLYFDYGKNKAYSPTPENPKVDLLIGTMNLKGLNTQAQKTGLLTGKFTGMKTLSGWKIVYRTADNMTDTESTDKIYNVGNIEDGTEINLGIDRSVEHLSKLSLTYDGIYNMEPFVNSENGRVVLFSNIEYELRNTDFKGNPLEIEKEKGMWYEPNWFLINLEGKYYNDNCSDKSHIHDSNRGQSFGGKAWNTNVYPHRYGVLTRTYIVTNKTDDNLISNTGDETINSISQSGTSMQKVTFNTKSYAYVMNSDMPEKGKMPWGIPDSAYVEITDKQFSADLDKCKFLGFDNASGNVEITQIKDDDGKVWIKMSLTDAGILALDRKIREITRGSGMWSFYGGPNAGLKVLQDSMVIALKSFRYTSVTSPGDNEHYPYGMVYYDVSKLESKLDGSKKEYYSYAKLEGDLFQLADKAAEALKATKEKKLFGVDLKGVQVIVGKNTAIGSNIFPGKYDNVVYSTVGSDFLTQKFYPDEKDNLRGDFFVQAPDADGFKQFIAIIEVPKKNKSVTYIHNDAIVQSPKTEFDMYMSGEVEVVGDSRPGKQEFSYSEDGNTFKSAADITDWSKITHVKLDLGELPKGSQVNIKLPLRTDLKTTNKELEAYIGGKFEATDYTGVKTEGYVNTAKYIYGNLYVSSSDVWWDINENGKLDDGEKKASGVKVEIFSPDEDITINGEVIPANTLIDTATTDSDGKYELRSYLLDAGQWVKVTMPDSKTYLTYKAGDTQAPKNSDFHRTEYKSPKLPRLVRDTPITFIGLGLIHMPQLSAKDVKIHVVDVSEEDAAKAVATSEHPTINPVPEYIELDDTVAKVDDKGKVSGKITGKTKASVQTKNTLKETDQGITEDKVKTDYDVIIYSRIKYDKNHADVIGNEPIDIREYYPSENTDGSDANTDEVTVLADGTMKRTGYKFMGWNTKPDGKGTKYSVGDKFKTGSVTDDTVLYAIWSLVWTPMEAPTRNISVEKIWKGAYGNNIEAPVESIKVGLYRDGAYTGKVEEITKAQNWKGVFEKVEVYGSVADPTPYEYTVKEINESGFNITIDNKLYKVTYEGDMKDGFKVTNQEVLPKPPTPSEPILPPLTRDVKVLKQWIDDEGRSIEGPVDRITVELYKDGVATGKTMEVTRENNWTATFEKIEVCETLGGKAHEYTVKEIGEDGGLISFSKDTFKVSYSGSMRDVLIITNSKEKEEKPQKLDEPKVPRKRIPKIDAIPKTGYDYKSRLYVSLMLISLLLVTLYVLRKRKNN